MIHKNFFWIVHSWRPTTTRPRFDDPWIWMTLQYRAGMGEKLPNMCQIWFTILRWLWLWRNFKILWWLWFWLCLNGSQIVNHNTLMIVIVKKFLRKVFSGLIAVRRDTRAHVPSLQKTRLTTKGKKWQSKVAKKGKVAQKKQRQQNCPKKIARWWCCAGPHNNMLIG